MKTWSRLQSLIDRAVVIYDSIPENWVILTNATTAPNGYLWISNGESIFSGKRKTALLKLKENENDKTN